MKLNELVKFIRSSQQAFKNIPYSEISVTIDIIPRTISFNHKEKKFTYNMEINKCIKNKL